MHTFPNLGIAVRLARSLALFWVSAGLLPSQMSAAEPSKSSVTLTNLAQLRQEASHAPRFCSIRLVAEVLDADPNAKFLTLRDSTGVEFVHLDWSHGRASIGQTILLECDPCQIKAQSFGLNILSGLVVDNDSTHGMKEESAAVHLHAGLNPIAVEWFNGGGSFGLKLEYSGPGLRRQVVPSEILLTSSSKDANQTTNLEPGLNYECYEGSWGQLPDFDQLHPTKTGLATNFDLGVRTRDVSVGLRFHGWIKLPQEGQYRFYLTSDDGSRLFAGESSLHFGPAPREAVAAPKTALAPDRATWVTNDGILIFAGQRPTGGHLILHSEDQDVGVELFDGRGPRIAIPLGSRVRVSGISQQVIAVDGFKHPGLILAGGWQSIRPTEVFSNLNAFLAGEEEPEPGRSLHLLPGEEPASSLTTAAYIRSLSAEVAKKKLPVTIRGVVTGILPSYLQGAVIQDCTKGIFLNLTAVPQKDWPHLGDYCEVSGTTDPGLFAPELLAQDVKHLGLGQMPRPIHANWEQIINGSLDTQFAEVAGVVTKVQGRRVSLLTDGGEVGLELSDFSPETLTNYTGALIRVCGCAFAMFNQTTHTLERGQLRIMSAAIDTVLPPPSNIFNAPRKLMGDLLLFDPGASPFRRVKVGGLVLYASDNELYLTDGTNGLRVSSTNAYAIAPGTTVDAVGFLQLGEILPHLAQSVLKPTGNAELPAPVLLKPEELLSTKAAGERVRLNATLVNEWSEKGDTILVMQSGVVAFRARLSAKAHALNIPPSGSLLELTGVYAPEGQRLLNGSPGGFQLLLRSPSDIRVLATPPWWNLQRLLILAAILIATVCALLIWNKQLLRLVQERTLKLENEMRSRQQAEVQHAAESERARIARDLHDELGVGLTEVSLLASAGLEKSDEAEGVGDRLHSIADKARSLVTNLDVIVWAIDPSRNSLEAFADYIASYSREFLSKAGIVCHLQIPIECEALEFSGPARHCLLMCVKEALNNVVRHAAASEVELSMSQESGNLVIVIADNGCGFSDDVAVKGDGRRNLRERMESLRGECQYESIPGKGTTIRLIVPMGRGAKKPAQSLTHHV